MRLFRMLFTFIMVAGLSGALFFWAGPKYAPQLMTKKGLDGLKAKLQGRYNRAKKIDSNNSDNGNSPGRYDYLEGAEDFEPTTTISEYGKSIQVQNGDDADIKEYSRYANEIQTKSQRIAEDLKEGRFQRILKRAKPKIKAFIQMIKAKANSAKGSNKLSKEDTVQLKQNLEKIEVELDNRSDMSSEKKER